jgi:hypothetical protein
MYLPRLPVSFLFISLSKLRPQLQAPIEQQKEDRRSKRESEQEWQIIATRVCNAGPDPPAIIFVKSICVNIHAYNISYIV